MDSNEIQTKLTTATLLESFMKGDQLIRSFTLGGLFFMNDSICLYLSWTLREKF